MKKADKAFILFKSAQDRATGEATQWIIHSYPEEEYP